MVVQNATEDVRFVDNAMVTDRMHVRFYAGMKLITSSGDAIGTICIMDTISRSFDESRVTILKDLAKQVIALLESEVRNEILTQSAGSVESVVLDERRANGMDGDQSPGLSHSPLRPLSLNDEVEKAFDLFSSEANAKGVELNSNIAEDLYVKFDDDIFNLVLKTAIFNGIKFCIYGGSVKVEAWKTSVHILISITENGAGMEPDRVQQLLDTSSASGSVLGLTACKRLLEAENGHMDILSEKGLGTTVTLTFPIG